MLEPHSATNEPAEPIAIVGMACRFPGAPDLDAFWRLLDGGENAITEGDPGSGAGRFGQIFPYTDVAGDASRFAGLLDDIDLFDPAFFRISPVEAETLDPQHRLMLETSWRALEDAGLDPDGLKGSRTGVFTGISNMDYRHLVLEWLDEAAEQPDPAVGLYAGIGTNLNGVSGRVAFVLGLEGHTTVTDAACASSLVAVHQGVTALHQRELDLAIAGGVNVILDPRLFEARTIAGILSPDGQCKAFDASANGFVRAEGCGVVVLKRLDEALADGDRIWGVLRGTAVNHGGASSGYTVPNEPAQVTVLRDALARADLAPSDVQYLEAHGTGTAVGDPIEVAALARVYAEGRDPESPLLIGSVKTNIGHLESAAGMAGLIKTVLAMRRGLIPKHLHFANPSPDIDWDELPVRVTGEATPWPATPGRPPRGAVSSYGMSGTNAHLVVEGFEQTEIAGSPTEDWIAGPAQTVDAPLEEPFADLAVPDEALESRLTRVLPLSAKNDPALRELAQRYLDRLGDGAWTQDALADLAWTTSVGRSRFNHRAGLVFDDAESLRERLADLAGAEAGPPPGSSRKVAFAYSGQGGQWVGMGRELYDTEPVARAVLDRCEAVHVEETGDSILDVMFGRNDADLDLSEWTQPALYALDCALNALWASVGVRPDVVIGHSFGELPAAQAAWVFSIEDGMRIAIARGRLVADTEEGAMAAVFAPRDRVESMIDEVNATSERAALGIAVDNGVNQVVTGLVHEVDAITERFEAEEVRVRRLTMSRVYHSALLEPVLPALEARANEVTVAPPRVDFISNVSGRLLEPGQALDGAYWSHHARQPVAFADGVQTAAEMGVDTVIEIGPHAVLGPMVSMIWPNPPGTPGAAVVIPSMLRPVERGGTEAETSFPEAVAQAFEAGLDVAFEGLYQGERRSRVGVPGYPFQLSRYWIEGHKRRRADSGHPLLGTRHESPAGEVSFETQLDPSEPAWLSDHRVFGRVVAPGALYGAMAASAALAEGSDAVVVDDMQLHSPLMFPEESDDGELSRRLQLVIAPRNGSGARRVEAFSRGPDPEWTLHVDGRVSAGSATAAAAGAIDVASIKSAMARGDASALYRARGNTGVFLGPAFRGLTDVWQSPGEALGEISLPGQVDRSGIDVHPLLLDACFQVVAGARGASEDDTAAYMPFGWERLWLNGPLPERLVCRAQMRDAGAAAAPSGAPEVLKADIWIYDSDGAPIGGVSGYTAKRATRAALLSSVDALDDLMYEVIWRDRPYAADGDAADTPGAWILSPDRGGVADRIAADLAARNQTVVIASATPTDGPGPTGALVDPYQRESWRSMVEALPDDVPLRGVVHLAALDGHGAGATTDEMRQDVTHASGSALALVQGLVDADAEPEHGVWFVSRGGQVLDHEHTGALAGAMLWGFGKVVTRELARLPARVIDLDPDGDALPDGFIDELLAPDGETLVAYRAGDRRAPRLVRGANGTPQLSLPEDAEWRITRDPDGDLRVEPAGERPLAASEIRVAVEATGADEGVRVLCGRVLEAAPDVTGFRGDDRVVGLSSEAIGPTAVVPSALAVPAPAGVRAPDLAAAPLTLILDELDAEASSSLADYIEDDPARVRAALGSVVARLATGELHAPPVRQWPVAQAAAAADFAMSDLGGEVAVLTASPIATGRLREDRTYLVTGGLGGIGGAVAGWLAERGAGVIVLNGRRPPDEAAEDVIRSLRERGATVQVEIADVADARALRDMLARIDEQLPPLGGVIHSVGALSDAALINQSWERFEEIVWPKVLGAWELHRATEQLDLDLFILFSSMSGVRGNPGQANYSSANAFLDQLARHRRALGLPGQAVQWGAWLGVGEAEQHRERIESTLAASGAEWMTPQQGVRALDRLVRQDLAVGAVTSMDWSTFAAGLRSVPPLIEELLTAASDDFDEADALAGDLVARVREAPEGERYGILVAFVQDLLQTLLRLPSRPAANVAFFELGIDSLMALELRARLNDALGGVYTASNTIAFDYPNAEDLGAHLVEALQAAGDETPAQPVAAPEPLAPPRSAVAEDAVAIVGMACRFPGAEDVAAFWRLLDAAASGVSEQRNGSGAWSGLQGDAAAGEPLYRQGAFVDGIDQFDASFFRVSPVEARNMDPQLRLLLETSWHALEDAGVDPGRLRGSRAGLYAGIGGSEYQDMMAAHGSPISYPGVNGPQGIGRVAFALGIDGPALPFDVVCASALVAVHHAASALRRGEVDIALAGGVNAVLSPRATRGMADFGMLSADGECRTFDASADGHVRGEGCGVVLLKRLDDAVADGDRIWAVVRGSAVNQNSSGASPTAPNGLAQRRVIEDALSDARLAPTDVDYLEAHGVASELGDAIELEAAAAVYGRDREPGQPLLVGSVKTNIGHLESASGAASLIKVVLSMQRGVIPAHLHFENPSTHLDWGGLPLRVTSSATPWPAHPDRAPIAGVSAFGLFGANAHVVVEGAVWPAEDASGDDSWATGAPHPIGPSADGSAAPAEARTARLLPLSGRTDAALRDLARSYLSWVDRYAADGPASRASEATLADAAWTAGSGRRHFAHRAGLVFHDAESLTEGLRAVAVTDPDDGSQPSPAVRVAFAYGSDANPSPDVTRSLYEAEPAVRAVLDRCAEAFEAATGQSLLAVIFGDDDSDVARSDPAAGYAVQCALTALWASVGLEPAVVAGGGAAGELAAAHTAGVLDLETGMRVAVALGRLSTGDGTAPAGAPLADVEAALGDTTPARPSVTLLSSVSGRAVDPDETFDAAYWLRRAQPSALRADALSGSGADLVVEIAGAGVPPGEAFTVVPGVLRADIEDPYEEFVRSVARVYESGVEIAFDGLFAGESRRRIALPGYPFQRRRFWMEPRRSPAAGDA
ncbi:MAG: SDR family NAD(P)-dependent oxidoreductase [Chloroflexi bacterium]|nr:SDR family NAD(P)-dependent oxidoreductase [Chloroflexota bacterium]